MQGYARFPHTVDGTLRSSDDGPASPGGPGCLVNQRRSASAGHPAACHQRGLALAAGSRRDGRAQGRQLARGRAGLRRLASLPPCRGPAPATAATLRRWGTEERLGDVLVVVSELLTNALRHALPRSPDAPRWPVRLGLLH